MNLAIASLFLATLDEKRNGDALPDIENVNLSGLPSGHVSFFKELPCRSRIYMSSNVSYQAPAHTAKRGVIEIAVVGNHTDDAAPGLFDFPLCKPEELDVVVL